MTRRCPIRAAPCRTIVTTPEALFASCPLLCWLLDFRFFELNVLFRNGVIFPEGQFFGLRTGILLRRVKEPCICRRQQFDLNGGSLGHCRTFPVAPVPDFIEKDASCIV